MITFFEQRTEAFVRIRDLFEKITTPNFWMVVNIVLECSNRNEAGVQNGILMRSPNKCLFLTFLLCDCWTYFELQFRKVIFLSFWFNILQGLTNYWILHYAQPCQQPMEMLCPLLTSLSQCVLTHSLFAQVCDLHDGLCVRRSYPVPALHAHLPHGLHRWLADEVLHVSLLYGACRCCFALVLRN